MKNFFGLKFPKLDRMRNREQNDGTGADWPGEGEDTHEEENHQKSQLLAGLGQGGQQTLKTVEMSDELKHHH